MLFSKIIKIGTIIKNGVKDKMENDRDLILAYYFLIGRMEGILEHNLYSTKKEFERFLKSAIRDFIKAEGKERQILEKLREDFWR